VDLNHSAEIGSALHGETAAPDRSNNRKLGLALGVFIAVVPFIGAFFTLRKGYSKTVRICAFAWLALFVIAKSKSPAHQDQTTSSASAVAEQTVAEHPMASYARQLRLSPNPACSEWAGLVESRIASGVRMRDSDWNEIMEGAHNHGCD